MADSEVDMRYQLDLSHVQDLPINSLGRRVRTRLYFTSESHLHTLLNVLRYASRTPAQFTTCLFFRLFFLQLSSAFVHVALAFSRRAAPVGRVRVRSPESVSLHLAL